MGPDPSFPDTSPRSGAPRPDPSASGRVLTPVTQHAFVGALVDRFPRKRILATGISFWATSTILCGTTFNYIAMFIGRCGVGLGEAAGGPATRRFIRLRMSALKSR